MKFTFLSENKTELGSCGAEFGLSIYIESDGLNILFDTGLSDLFAANAAALGVDLARADACVISHGHFDHTNGLPRFCEINERAPVYVHRDAFYTTYGTTNGVIDDYNCGILWTDEQKDKLRERFVLTDGPLWLNDATVISGTIPDVPGLKPIERFYRLTPDGMVPDDLSHEQFLAFDTQEGIVIFSGCSHKGIIAAVRYAAELFPSRPVKAVIGGMHLMNASKDERIRIIEALDDVSPEIVMPVHCTGIEAIAMFKEHFGDRCITASAGKRYII